MGGDALQLGSLALHWPRVTSISGSPPLRRGGRWAPAYTVLVEFGKLYLTLPYVRSEHEIRHCDCLYWLSVCVCVYQGWQRYIWRCGAETPRQCVVCCRPEPMSTSSTPSTDAQLCTTPWNATTSPLQSYWHRLAPARSRRRPTPPVLPRYRRLPTPRNVPPTCYRGFRPQWTIVICRPAAPLVCDPITDYYYYYYYYYYY